jgi:hypothetical protein
MSNFKGIVNLLLLSALLCFTTVVAQTPIILNYQGRVLSGGIPFDGIGQFKFALVNSDGSAFYWRSDGGTGANEPATSVALNVIKGLFSARLGDNSIPNMAVIPPAALQNTDLRLRVWFNDGVLESQLLVPDARFGVAVSAEVSNSARTVALTSPSQFDFPRFQIPFGLSGGKEPSAIATYEIPRDIKKITNITAQLRTDWEGSYRGLYGTVYLRIRQNRGSTTTVLYERSTTGGVDFGVDDALDFSLNHDSYIYQVEVFLQRYEGAGPGYGNWTGSCTVNQLVMRCQKGI